MSRAMVAALLLALSAGCTLSRRESSEVHLRVATYNIQAGGGDLSAVTAAIRDLNADIIGLQEVDVHWSARSGFADQATALGKALGMHVRFAPIYSIPDADRAKPVREFGVAILSRHLIVDFRNEALTRLSTQDSTATPTPMPGLLHAVVQVRGRPVRVFVTHLDYRADPRVRAQQVTEMKQYVQQSLQPALLLGDLNAVPDAPELRPLFEVLDDSWESSIGPGYTYPATAPAKRIDYVLTSRGAIKVRSSVVAPVVVTDHRPVVVELVLLAPMRPVP